MINKVHTVDQIVNTLFLKHSSLIVSNTINSTYTLEILLSVNFSESKPMSSMEEERNNDKITYRCSSSEDIIKDKKVFSEGPIQWVVNTFEPYEEPGWDGINIFPALTQKVATSLAQYLLESLTSSYELGYIPHFWREDRKG